MRAEVFRTPRARNPSERQGSGSFPNAKSMQPFRTRENGGFPKLTYIEVLENGESSGRQIVLVFPIGLSPSIFIVILLYAGENPSSIYSWIVT